MQSVVGSDVFFLLIGAILVLAMHAGFAFLEVARCARKPGERAHENPGGFQRLDDRVFFIGYAVAYGINFLPRAGIIDEERS